MIDKNHASLKRLHEAQCTAVAQLEKSNIELTDKIQYLESMLTNCNRGFEIQKTITRNAIEQHQQQSTAYQEEIQLLKAKITAIGG